MPAAGPWQCYVIWSDLAVYNVAEALLRTEFWLGIAGVVEETIDNANTWTVYAFVSLLFVLELQFIWPIDLSTRSK